MKARMRFIKYESLPSQASPSLAPRAVGRLLFACTDIYMCACVVTWGCEMSGDSRSSSMEITLTDIRDNMEHEADTTEECSLPGMSGEPKVCPRVGDQYQAIIPDFIERKESSLLNAGEVNEAINYLLPVLSIPLMWAPNKARDAERLRALHGHGDPFSEESQLVLNSESCSILTEQAEEAAENQAEVSDIRLRVDSMELGVASREGTGRQLAKEKNLYPLPGIPDEPWSDFEHDSFLLALYIFGKDLHLVKKFVETKKMEDVISHYYGPFYKCSEYQRWAKCLRSRSRKSIHGQRMFTGGRQQELFSRLNNHISEETSNKLSEASKMFKEEGISFEEYIFTLKDLVGTKVLIEVIAIGKGKQDLTGIAAEPVKLHRSVSARRETQQDKGLSSLSCTEIAEQLTSSRLSKTKSTELFWEAVWPRLLAGGWHSEQPKDHGVLTLKHQLVFLIPGIKKFRRKHVKGQHYFDSVSDVLNKVASDPRILELENEKEKDSGHEENHSDEQDLGLPNGKHNGYLKLCNSNQKKDEMDFMIVDTSKHRGSKVRWMETLPVHSADISSSSSACSGTGSDSSSEKSDGKGEETKLTKYSKCGFDFEREACADISSQMTNGIGSLKNQEVDSVDTTKRSSKKHHLGGKVKSGPSKYLSPLKRHQVNSAGHDDSDEVAENKNDKQFILCLPNPHKVNEKKPSHKGLGKCLSPQDSVHILSESSHLSLPNSSPKMNEGNEYVVCENSNETEKLLEQSLPHAVIIDLNIPQVPEDVGTNHDMIHNSTYSSSLAENISLAHKHKDTSRSNTSSPCHTSPQVSSAKSNLEQQQPPKMHQEQQQPKMHLEQQQPKTLQDQQQPKIQQEQKQQPKAQQEQQLLKTQQQPNMLGLRQSTRNRPLTTKALEAFESSFFEMKKKRKPKDSPTSRPPRRRRGNSISNSTSDSGIGSNEMPGTRIEEDGPSGNSGNAPLCLMPHN
uniref:SANT domain-containing protein n=2 Tax=Kalanchoe fedtschenkoi TaxID=63787 RepID=A0A7N0TTB2_KALFE